MPLNFIKKYPDLLEILHLSEYDRKISLMKIFKRDIEDNDHFSFRGKRIYPIKTDGRVDMDRQFMHLTCEEVVERRADGNTVRHRIFEIHRSQRLHWIKPHTAEEINHKRIVVFSTMERDQKKRENVMRTYIYNQSDKYVLVFEPQMRNGSSYYLLTAYYLNKEYGERQIIKKMKKSVSLIEFENNELWIDMIILAK